MSNIQINVIQPNYVRILDEFSNSTFSKTTPRARKECCHSFHLPEHDGFPDCTTNCLILHYVYLQADKQGLIAIT